LRCEGRDSGAGLPASEETRRRFRLRFACVGISVEVEVQRWLLSPEGDVNDAEISALRGLSDVAIVLLAAMGPRRKLSTHHWTLCTPNDRQYICWATCRHERARSNGCRQISPKRSPRRVRLDLPVELLLMSPLVVVGLKDDVACANELKVWYRDCDLTNVD